MEKRESVIVAGCRKGSKSVLHTTARFYDLKQFMNELTATVESINNTKIEGRH
jgi:hypothetical protein